MSAWVVSPKPKQTTSLLDIMSEELIHKIHIDESPDQSIEIQDDCIYSSEFEIINDDEFDSDLALALALQEIEELEHETLLEQQRNKSNDDYSKINVSYLPGEHVFPARKVANFLEEDDVESSAITDHRIMNGLRSFEQKRHQKGIVSGGRVSAKDTKITSEGVLDPTTRMILYKLIQNNKIDKLHGVIKTGKEANVYHGYRQPGSRQNSNKGHESAKFHWDDETSDFAVKIFRTTLNEFGNRQDYFHGDHRYQGQKFTKGGTKESIAKVTTLMVFSHVIISGLRRNTVI